MGYRNIEINDRTWKFKIGKSFVQIRGPDGEKYVPSVSDVKGITPTAFDKGRRSGEQDGMIGPGDIKRFVLGQGSQRTIA